MKKKTYVAPWCEVISLMDEIMIAKSSVVIKKGSTEEEWGADEEVPGEEEEDVAARAYYRGTRAISKWDRGTAQEFLAAMPDGTSGYWDAVEK
ncbi:MAG: hypothetical protein ACFNOO_06455, partial [Segatella oulorum]